MTFRQLIVRLCLGGALTVAGIATYCAALGHSGWQGAATAWAGGAAVGLGLLGIVRATWAPRAEGGEQSNLRILPGDRRKGA